MRSIDRMEWPRRFKLKGSVLILVLLGVAFGIFVHRQSQSRIAASIEISEVSFDDWGNQYIELGYTIENKTDKTMKVNLLAKVWDAQGVEIASALFDIELDPRIRQTRSKLLDRLNRSLRDGEAPHRAQISLYTRKIL